MSNPTVSNFNFNGYQLWKITANNANDPIVGPGYLNGDANYSGALISQVDTITPDYNPDSMGNPFCYTSSVNGLSIIVKELTYIGGSIQCTFDDSTNPGNPYTVTAVLCDTQLDYNTLAINYVS